MGERAARKRNTADCLPVFEPSQPCDNTTPTEVGHQEVETAEPEVALKDGSNPIRLGVVDGDLRSFES
jgi:hypothetical protein